MSPFYRRLLLWFCAANIATLLISVVATRHLTFLAYHREPDWAALAEQADAFYIHGGPKELSAWAEDQWQRGINATLFEDGRDLLPPRLPFEWRHGSQPDTEPGERPSFDSPPHPPPEMDSEIPPATGPRSLPPPLADHLPQLLSGDNVVLRPHPDLYLAGQSVLGSDGVKRRLIAMRTPRRGERLDALLGVQIALSLLGIGIIGWWLARGIARPVAALTVAARRMATGDLGTRVDERWTRADDEISALARDFNTMAYRVEALVTHERRVLQDISHELRSPLARLQLNLELARRGNADQFERAEREIVRLDRLLTEVLALARLEGGLPGMTREPCDLAELAAARIDETRSTVGTSELRLDAKPGVIVSGSAALLERALDNLLANAVKYGGNGTIDIVARADGDHAQLIVRDHGAGVASADIDALFRPFFRGVNAAGSEGQGLGLAVVARIAHAHGGDVAAENADGGGLVVTLRLPLAPPTAKR